MNNNRKLLLHFISNEESIFEYTDDPIAIKNIDTVNKSGIHNIFIISSTEINTDVLEQLEKIYEDQKYNITPIFLNDFKNREGPNAILIIEKLSTCYNTEGTILISPTTPDSGIVLTCFFVFNGKSIHEAVERTQKYFPDFLMDENQYLLINNFEKYNNNYDKDFVIDEDKDFSQEEQGMDDHVVGPDMINNHDDVTNDNTEENDKKDIIENDRFVDINKYNIETSTEIGDSEYVTKDNKDLVSDIKEIEQNDRDDEEEITQETETQIETLKTEDNNEGDVIKSENDTVDITNNDEEFKNAKFEVDDQANDDLEPEHTNTEIDANEEEEVQERQKANDTLELDEDNQNTTASVNVNSEETALLSEEKGEIISNEQNITSDMIGEERAVHSSSFNDMELKSRKATDSIQIQDYHKSFLSRFTIKVKLIFISSLVIVLALSIMIFLVTYFFKKDNTIRVRESNHNLAQTIAFKVQSDLNIIIEKAHIIGAALLQKSDSVLNDETVQDMFFQTRSDMIFFGVAEKSSEQLQFKHSMYNSQFLTENQLPKDNINSIYKHYQTDLLKVFNGSSIFINISSSFNHPVLCVGLPFVLLNGKVKSIAILYIRLDNFIKVFQTTGVSQAFMINDAGEIIAHSDSALVLSSINMRNLPIVKKVMSSKIDNDQMRYTDEHGVYFLGSFKKLTSFGLSVIVVAQEEKIFENVYNLQFRNIIILLIILNVSILVVFFFAKTLSHPIINLVRATELFHESDLPAKNIKSKDEVGFLTESFSIMVDSIRDSQRRLQDYAENLEKMVAERTLELTQARDALWGEMKLAKKIQTVLLPETPHIPGYQISGYMMPADEVGGDYYDVINAEGSNWVVIGDVSGHGVSSGLIMMMVQTAVRIIITQHPDISPSQLLTIVNSVLVRNIKQFGEKKYMTISLLHCNPDGVFSFAGKHLDHLLYRAETGEVEFIKSKGFWIGMLPDLGKMLKDDSFQLFHNDVLLLYTDGITEIKDEHGVLFSKERLVTVLQTHARSPVDDIKNSVLQNIENYENDDDVTLLVLKMI